MTVAKALLVSVAAVAALALAAPALARDGDAGAAPFKTDALYKAFHGTAGIDRVVDTLVDLSIADPRISDIFKGQDIPHLRQMLDQQFCYLLKGPCAYTGKDMKEGHKDLGLQQTDFNALVENLQKAMDKEGVPFHDQNRFLAKLAPMERLVVERSGAPKLLQR
jgi:hemoglobin